MHLRWVILTLFVLVYGYLFVFRHHKAKAIWIGIGLMLAARYMLIGQDPTEHGFTLGYVLFKSINWNVIGILAGAMMLAEIFIDSKVPVLLADVLAAHCKNTVTALLGICALSGFVSIFVDNVTTVLIVAPVALIISRRTGVSPVPFLIGMAISSNLEGAATLIGDPPSMLLADSYNLTFNDFFFYKSPLDPAMGYRPSMFFIMQVGALASLLALYFLFRRYRRPMVVLEAQKPTSWVPTIMIGIMVAHLALSSVFDPEFVWLAGTGNVVLALIGFGRIALRDRAQAKGLLKRYDLPTIFFLAGIFAVAQAMFDFGWISAIAVGIRNVVGKNPFIAFTVIVWFSVLVSGFIDNIAYIALMLPVTHELAAGIGGRPFLYAAGLLVGACLGGNITPIGAACNVVAVGILRKEGHHISFWDFARIGLPFTLAATGAGYIVTWLIWGH